jgi:HlyD family secretion protein
VAAAQDNVQRAASRGAQAAVQQERAASDLKRSEQLAQQGFIAPTKLESDRLALRAAEREVDAAAAERRIAAHDLEQARAALGVAAAPVAAGGSARAFAVRSPVAGRVLRVLQSSEGVVALGTPLVEVGDTTRLEIVAELLTTDAVNVLPGSRVHVERWGGAHGLEGRVRAVEPAAFTKVSALGVEEQRVRVLIDLTSPRELWRALGDGFRVGVRVVTLAVPEALVVPVSAVFPLPAGAPAASVPASAPDLAPSGGTPAAGDGRGSQRARGAAHHAVFVLEGGRVRQVPVVLGARNGSMAWIQAGLARGQQVVVYPPAAVRDGVRATARKT